MDSTMILVVGMSLGMVFGFLVTYVAMHHDAQHTQQAIYGMYLDEMYKRMSLERRERSGEVMRQNKVRIIKRIDGKEVV